MAGKVQNPRHRTVKLSSEEIPSNSIPSWSCNVLHNTLHELSAELYYGDADKDSGGPGQNIKQ